MMKNIKVVFASSLLLASISVFAEPHLDEAITHTNAAIEHGRAGHASVLVEHATPALEHTLSGAIVAKGAAKGHVFYAIADLEQALKHGKEKGEGHVGVATTYAESALEHLRAANK